MFGLKNKEAKQSIWKRLQGMDSLKHLMESQDTFILYKHSFSCGLSAMAKSSLESAWKSEDLEGVPSYLIDVINERPLSQHVEQQTGILHESPQLLVFKQGQVTYHDSHRAIDYGQMLQGLR